jgi:hypothetical protein
VYAEENNANFCNSSRSCVIAKCRIRVTLAYTRTTVRMTVATSFIFLSYAPPCALIDARMLWIVVAALIGLIVFHLITRVTSGTSIRKSN